MEKQSTPRPRTVANNAMWQAIRGQDIDGLKAALANGANPQVRRMNQYPLIAVIDTTDESFVIAAWKALCTAGANPISQIELAPSTTLAVSLLSRNDGGLEAVWEACPALRRSLLHAAMHFSNHKNAGLTAEQWPASLDRVFALDGCHSVLGYWLATFGGDWHHGGFTPDVVERLVAFDVDPRRLAAWSESTDTLCQSTALYDQHGAVVNELCHRHQDWLHRDGGSNGHKLVVQLIKYGEGKKYSRLHDLAPHLLASDSPSAMTAMAAATFNCSSVSLMSCFDSDPAKALAAQGFSLRNAFSVLEPQLLYDMIKTWQRNHWVAGLGNNLPQAVALALDRVQSLGMDIHDTWTMGVERAVEDWGEVSGSLEGVGLMHVWCTNNEIHHDTKGRVIADLAGFETPRGPALLEVATRSIKDDQEHGAFLVPNIKALNWALSCGADMAHPGTMRAAERILFALLDNKALVTDRNAERWVDAVNWLVEHDVALPHLARLNDLDAIKFERPNRWKDEVGKIKMALVVANHERMHHNTAEAVEPAGAKPRF